MRFVALLITLVAIANPAVAKEWKTWVEEVFNFPIECPPAEYSTSALEIVQVEGENITMRPVSICVKEGHIYDAYGFIAPDGTIHFPFPKGDKMDAFVLEFLTHQ